MNSYKSALNKLKRNNISIKSETISIKDSLNRVLAKDVVSPVNYPACDNTAFDGYAVSSKETKFLNVRKSKKFKINKIIWAITKKNPFKSESLFNLKERIAIGKKITKKYNFISIKFYEDKIKSNKTIDLINYLKKKKGLLFSGNSPDKSLPEIIELKNHPWFIGVQFHPEFKSRPLTPHPLFSSFIKAAKNHKK